MKISFLVTYYNQQEYVRRSLDSILAISMPCKFEILVGDDGSTDETKKIVDEYITKYPMKIKLYEMERNNGETDPIIRVSQARLALLEESSGDYIVYLDGDDFYCDTEFVKEAVSIFSTNENVSVVSFDYKESFDDLSERSHCLGQNGIVNTSEYTKFHFIHVGACIHRKYFDNKKIQMIKNCKYFDDNDIVMNSLSYGSMYHVSRVIYSYTQHVNSSWHTVSEIEKNFLNVLNYDIEICYFPEGRKDLFQRYLMSIFILYLCRNIVHENCNKNIYYKCLTRCSSFENGLAYYLLTGKSETKLYKRIIVLASVRHFGTYKHALEEYRKLKGGMNDK